MRLVLLRHGIAEDAATQADAARGLTAEGRKKTQEVCRALAGMDLGVRVILSSPLVRAKETAAILRDTLGIQKPVQEAPFLVPESPPQSCLVPLGALKVDCVALVGHEPHLSKLVAWAVGGGTFDIRKAGVVILEGTAFPGPGTASLVGLFAPRHLRPLI